MTYKMAQKELLRYKDLQKAEFLKRFFKTGKGQYAESDDFIGVNVPVTRSVARKYRNLPISDVFKLLKSKIHEDRLMALGILVMKYPKASLTEKERIFTGYITHIAKHINNWDLVDLSAPNIVGKHLLNRGRHILYKLSKSKNLWEKRVSIVATLYLIRQNEYIDTIKISENLLFDDHDLIHKAVGWMLREMGKKSEPHLRTFLVKHAHKMPRTMLRYAIEKYPEKIRKKFLEQKNKMNAK